MLNYADFELQNRVLAGGEYSGKGACGCAGDECALCMANFGAGALDLDVVDALLNDQPEFGIGSLPALGGMPADAVNDIDEIAAWQGTVYGTIGATVDEILETSATEVAYLHLYFAWNIDDPDLPCHRDMWSGGNQGGCGIWRAIFTLTRRRVELPDRFGGTTGVTRWEISDRIRSLRPVWPLGSGSELFSIPVFMDSNDVPYVHWFPSVRRRGDRVYLAHNMQVPTAGSPEDISVWSYLNTGTSPTNPRGILEARFPNLSSGIDRLAYTDESSNSNVVIAELNPITLEMTSNELVSDSEALFEDTAADPAFVLDPGRICLVYQGVDPDADDNSSRLMLACQGEEGADFSAEVSQQIGDRCGHPAVTGNGKWVVCSDDPIYIYPLTGRFSDSDRPRSLHGDRGGLFVNILQSFRDNYFQFEDQSGVQPPVQRLLQVYANWGGTDDLMVFTAMRADSLGNVDKSKIFLVNQSVESLDSDSLIDTRDAEDPPYVGSDTVFDLSNMITQNAIRIRLIEEEDSWKLDYCTSDFFITETSD